MSEKNQDKRSIGIYQKIKYMVIAPTKHLDMTVLGDAHFVLAHRVLNDPVYSEFYDNETKYKLMDNGAFELSKSIPMDDVLRAADQIDADEIVAPDFPSDPKKSYELTREFVQKMGDIGYKIQLVPHGQTPKEYLEYYQLTVDLCNQFGAECIGFSILDLWKWEERLRPYVIHALWHWDALPEDIEYHLLGLDDPIELLMYKGLPIRSVDSSLPISLAYNNEELHTGIDGKHLRVPDDAELNFKQMKLAVKNIQELKLLIE